MSSSVIQLEGVVSLIHRFPALAGVNLEVESGEMVLLRGANGAGKSTLLRLCAALAPVSRGTGKVLGLDLEAKGDRREVRRRVGLLGHQTALYDDLTVAQNIRFWAAANRATEAEQKAAMRKLGLSGRLASVKVSGLSAGQRRRTALAVLVARRPQLWLLDEPHAGLDAEGRDLLDELVGQAASAGATVLMATHDVGRLEELTTRTVTIAGGQVAGDTEAPLGADILRVEGSDSHVS